MANSEEFDTLRRIIDMTSKDNEESEVIRRVMGMMDRLTTLSKQPVIDVSLTLWLNEMNMEMTRLINEYRKAYDVLHEARAGVRVMALMTDDFEKRLSNLESSFTSK